ncbi:TlpA family protein disulfide reductase [Actinophytocola sp.]|uniref:TlpA family protein disulfide reductase n=1 Tax=Actinophytocola sp. TaxID=1872138 RepID=UPI003D6C5016
MAALTAAVVLVGLLGVVNLLFSFGIIRRLSEHTELLDGFGRRPASEPIVLEAGRAVADFDARTVDGARVSRDDLAGTTLVGVFSPGCAACEVQLDEFVAYARTHPGGRRQALAVVVGSEAESASYVERLAAAAQVVREPVDGPVSESLAVRGFPAFVLLDGDIARVSGSAVGELPAAVAG